MRLCLKVNWGYSCAVESVQHGLCTEKSVCVLSVCVVCVSVCICVAYVCVCVVCVSVCVWIAYVCVCSLY